MVKATFLLERSSYANEVIWGSNLRRDLQYSGKKEKKTDNGRQNTTRKIQY
jgi:hypothetical protein